MPACWVVRFSFKNFRSPDKISLSFVLPNKASERKRINTDGKKSGCCNPSCDCFGSCFAAGTEGGFNGPVSTSPVSQVQGKAGGFNDAYARGTVNVEIDRKYWNGVTVSPEDNVEIQGKIDKERNNICVDVKQISKIGQNLH
ncbi:TPA: YgiW/YdeI family stress tolerance OB fold protein [Salmonella enterica subsp. enterica]